MPPKVRAPKETGTIAEVWAGKYKKTKAGLTKSDLMLSSTGKPISIATHEKREAAKRERKRIKCAQFAEDERKRTGAIPVFDLATAPAMIVKRVAERTASPRPEIQVARDVPKIQQVVYHSAAEEKTPPSTKTKAKESKVEYTKGRIPDVFLTPGDKGAATLLKSGRPGANSLIYKNRVWYIKPFPRFFNDGGDIEDVAEIVKVISKYKTMPNTVESDTWLFNALKPYDQKNIN